MTLLATNDARSKRLERVFWAFVKTPKPILTARDAEMFLEAAQCRPSAKECLETIAANHHGMEAVRASVRISLSPVFISKSIVPFVSFMSGPEVKAIFEGKLLQKLVAGIVYPPTFWDALVDCYIRNQLPGGERDVEVFAWLCLEVVSHPDADVHAIASSLTTTLEASPFVANANPKIREYGHRIQKIIQLKATSDAPSTNLDVETPGGRNDNDFADFRAISIYPTRDELTSTQRPFYRRAAEVDNANPHDRPGIHLDNQFRLLREDMLAELREDLRIAFGNKWRGRNVSVFHGLRPTGLDTGDYHRPRAPSLLVSVGGGLESLKNVKSEKRKAFLFENKRIAPHKGFGVLCKGTDVIGFAFIVRDVDLLCKDPPVLGLQFPSADILSKALVALLTPQDIRFVVVDTPVFAYEPILERLKDVLELPLEDELFGRLSDHADFEPSVFSQAFIDKYLSNERESGTIVVGGQRFALDKSQREALAHALGSPLSVIQGPPGKWLPGVMSSHWKNKQLQFRADRANISLGRHGKVVHRRFGNQDPPRRPGRQDPCLELHQPCPRPVPRRYHQDWNQRQRYRPSWIQVLRLYSQVLLRLSLQVERGARQPRQISTPGTKQIRSRNPPRRDSAVIHQGC